MYTRIDNEKDEKNDKNQKDNKVKDNFDGYILLSDQEAKTAQVKSPIKHQGLFHAQLRSTEFNTLIRSIAETCQKLGKALTKARNEFTDKSLLFNQTKEEKIKKGINTINDAILPLCSDLQKQVDEFMDDKYVAKRNIITDEQIKILQDGIHAIQYLKISYLTTDSYGNNDGNDDTTLYVKIIQQKIEATISKKLIASIDQLKSENYIFILAAVDNSYRQP